MVLYFEDLVVIQCSIMLCFPLHIFSPNDPSFLSLLHRKLFYQMYPALHHYIMMRDMLFSIFASSFNISCWEQEIFFPQPSSRQTGGFKGSWAGLSAKCSHPRDKIGRITAALAASNAQTYLQQLPTLRNNIGLVICLLGWIDLFIYKMYILPFCPIGTTKMAYTKILYNK